MAGKADRKPRTKKVQGSKAAKGGRFARLLQIRADRSIIMEKPEDHAKRFRGILSHVCGQLSRLGKGEHFFYNARVVARHIVIPDGFDASESISGANNFWVNSCVFTDSGVRVTLTPDTYDLMLQAVDLQTCEQGSSSFNELNKGGFLGVELPKIGAQEEMTKRLYDENATPDPNIVSFAMKMYNKFIRTGTVPNIAWAMAGEMQEQFEQAAPDQRVGFISLSASEITAKWAILLLKNT